MSPAPVEPPLPKASSAAGDSCAGPRFSNLRGVRWRINLGILPCSSSALIEDLRRVAADCRRRYASLRRRLLIDPHLPKDGNRSPDLAKDNPLSQNPDSIWGRFFRNAELEKMVDQDLSRLYPDHGSYFQTPACQAMLRRILLLWCLRHPEYGYRQGMHELLAPLLYVLHVDLQHLSQVQGLYEDYFNDEFDETSFLERDPVSDPRFTKATDKDAGEKDSRFDGSTAKVGSLDELDPDTRDIFMLSDAYGAEGELGVVLSERFMEHDAYCMFDSLMNGARGVVAMADFFSPSPPIGSSTGVPPVIEASSALYHLLSIVDSSLHGHLVELGVEPQYFALRWLRVLFGREFSLDDLLAIWDELFSSPNNTCAEDDAEYSFRILCSPRGAFIAAMAVSMLLHVRSSLFATENATSCLKRLLNFPKNTNVKKLIEKAKSLQALALETNTSSSPLGSFGNKNKSLQALRVYNCSFNSASSKTPLHTVPDSYWEEKWRVLHKEEALKNGSRSEKSSRGKGSLVERLHLSRAESDPSPAKSVSGEKNPRSSVRRRLLDDLSREVGSDADFGKTDCDEVVPDHSCSKPPSVEGDGGKQFPGEPDDQNITGRTSDCMVEETCLSGDNSSAFSTTASPHSMGNEEENASEKSSVTSNSFIADNDEETTQVEERCSDKSEISSVHESEVAATVKPQPGTDGPAKREMGLKERKPLAGKFQWFWRLGRGSGEGNSERGGSSDAQRSTIAGNICKHIGGSASECNSCRDSCRQEVGDKKVMGTLKSLGNSMVENIQVIESAFQQDRDRTGNIETAMAALEELRKISNILSGM